MDRIVSSCVLCKESALVFLVHSRFNVFWVFSRVFIWPRLCVCCENDSSWRIAPTLLISYYHEETQEKICFSVECQMLKCAVEYRCVLLEVRSEPVLMELELDALVMSLSWTDSSFNYRALLEIPGINLGPSESFGDDLDRHFVKWLGTSGKRKRSSIILSSKWWGDAIAIFRCFGLKRRFTDSLFKATNGLSFEETKGMMRRRRLTWYRRILFLSVVM